MRPFKEGLQSCWKKNKLALLLFSDFQNLTWSKFWIKSCLFDILRLPNYFYVLWTHLPNTTKPWSDLVTWFWPSLVPSLSFSWWSFLCIIPENIRFFFRWILPLAWQDSGPGSWVGSPCSLALNTQISGWNLYQCLVWSLIQYGENERPWSKVIGERWTHIRWKRRLEAWINAY